MSIFIEPLAYYRFDILAGLFNWVGLQTNAQKMVCVAFQSCHMPGQMPLDSYERRTMGTGPTFR